MSRTNTMHHHERYRQFVRLLAEINAVGLTPAQIADLCESMDVRPPFIREILTQAEDAFLTIKANALRGERRGTDGAKVSERPH